jgi:hypothetical protein
VPAGHAVPAAPGPAPAVLGSPPAQRAQPSLDHDASHSSLSSWRAFVRATAGPQQAHSRARAGPQQGHSIPQGKGSLPTAKPTQGNNIRKSKPSATVNRTCVVYSTTRYGVAPRQPTLCKQCRAIDHPNLRPRGCTRERRCRLPASALCRSWAVAQRWRL